MTAVAVVGLGAMGSRIASRLLEAGHDLVVWNRHEARAAPLVERGAVAAGSPADAARRTELVLTMVSDPAALRAVTEGPEGIAASVGGATTVAQMSTVGVAATVRLESELAPDVALVDAPVLGSVVEAEGGTLTIFAGGSPDVVERWTPLLSDLGTVLAVGPVGAGTAAKLVANSTLFTVLGGLGEAIALADGLGLRRDVAFEVLGATPLGAQAERRRSSIETGSYPPRFPLELARKDSELVLEAAARSSTQLRLAAAAAAWFTDAVEAGLGEKDYSAVVERIVARK